MNNDIIEREEIERLNNAVKVSDKSKGLPYVFISYKSHDRLLMLRIVHRLNTVYGLRVYYDKEFSVNNELWVTQMEQNMSSALCYGMLAFFTKKYYMSYAACMEMMYSQTDSCLSKRHRNEEEYMTLVPVNLEPSPHFTDVELDQDTGLPHNNTNPTTEKDAFLTYYSEIANRLKLNYYKPNRKEYPLTVKSCLGIIKMIYEYANVNENRYYESTFDSFCNTLAENIHNSVYKTDENGQILSVFDEAVYHQAISRFRQSGDVTAMENVPSVPAPVTTEEQQNPTANIHETYWGAFMAYAFEKPDFAAVFRRRRPSSDQTMNFSVGSSQCRITVSRSRRKKSLSCELQIPDNKPLFEHIFAQKETFEQQAGTPFEWRSSPEKKSCSIALVRSFAEAWDNDSAVQFEWLSDTMLMMQKLFVKEELIPSGTRMVSSDCIKRASET